MLYSVLYSSIYYGYFCFVINNEQEKAKLPISSLSAIVPAKLEDKVLKYIKHAHTLSLPQWQSRELLSLSWSFFKQSILKQFLTDGKANDAAL